MNNSKKIKRLKHTYEVKSKKMFKLTPVVNDYEYMKYQLLEYEQNMAYKELEKILWEDYKNDVFDYIFYPNKIKDKIKKYNLE